MGATSVLSPQDCLVSVHNSPSPLNCILSSKGKKPTHPKKAIDGYPLPAIHSNKAFSTHLNPSGYSNPRMLSSRSLSTGSSDVFNPNPNPNHNPNLGFCSNPRELTVQSLFTGGIEVPNPNLGFCSNPSELTVQSPFTGGIEVPNPSPNPKIRTKLSVLSSRHVFIGSGDVHNFNPTNPHPNPNPNVRSNLRVLSTRSLSAGSGNVHNLNPNSNPIPTPNPKLVPWSKSASISGRNPILTLNPNPNPNHNLSPNTGKKKAGGSKPVVENGNDIIMVSKGEEGGGGFRVSCPVAIPNRDKFLINEVERWAGPSFSVSPPPASLPLPTFLKSHLLEEKAEVLSPSPSLPSQGSIDFAFATRDLKRILNLDV